MPSKNTPEGRVKAATKRLLGAYKPGMYFNMPVPTGYGTPMLDFVGCYKGRFFAIETKAPGKKPTPRQRLTIFEMEEAGAAVFVVWDDKTLENVKEWLDAVADSAGIGEAQRDGDAG